MKEIIVREYLESLKEDSQLDLLFPILLEVLEFQIVTTPKEYKGHKQYGKDIIALGIDPHDGERKRFYFELKGGNDRNINTKTYTKEDGIRMSIIEAKDKNFSDNSIAGFNALPIKIVIVHNGVLMPDIRETFDDFIKKEFPKNNVLGFERWDIHKLTHLFSEHLFGEYLLTNKENIILFKRVLVFMDVPENSQRDFRILVNNIISNTEVVSLKKNYFPVKITRFFETLRLIGIIVHKYSHEIGNLEISKKWISYLVLKTWYWILLNKLENDRRIREYFEKITLLHRQVLDEYFRKILPIAKFKYGLFSENGGRYEQIGYPIRCMEFLKYLNYWYLLKQENELTTKEKEEILTRVVDANDGTYRPILDIHSIPILQTVLFYIDNGFIDNAKKYIVNVFEQIILGKKYRGRLPDGNNNPQSLIRLTIRGEKSIYYEDRTSMLIGMLFELLAALGMEKEYILYKEEFKNIHLATYIPLSDDLLLQYFPDSQLSHEEMLFNQTLYDEGYQSEIILDNDFDVFVKKTKNKDEYTIEYRTIKVGYPSLLILAHTFYDTPLPPRFWRASFRK